MKKVMIIDDEILNRKIVGAIIRNNTDYSTITMENGIEALKYIESLSEEELPDIILLDIRMPKIDGFEFVKRLKDNEKAEEIPVIFITALSDFDTKIKAFKMGGVDYISKPFNKYELLERINVHLHYKDISERRADIDFEKLEENRDDEMVDLEFLSHAFHDLKNPVAIIQMYSSALIDETKDVLNDEMKYFLEVIFNTSTQMENIIKDISYLTKLKVGKRDIEKTTVSFNNIIKDVVNDYNLKNAERKITLNAIEKEYKISVDVDLMELAIGNILDLISKIHTEKGNIEISFEENDKNLDMKISFNQKQEILDDSAYFGVNSSITGDTEIRGTGFKLAISKEIIEKHNGEINIINKEELDSIIQVLLPLE